MTFEKGFSISKNVPEPKKKFFIFVVSNTEFVCAEKTLKILLDIL